MKVAPLRVAVTGASGRLGSALLAAIANDHDRLPVPWGRPDYDLDDPRSAARVVERDRPEVVIHCAAWTDVDGCAHDPELAMRRNAEAVGVLARACALSDVRLMLISTNEVFDGERTDGLGYREDDPPGPRNAYGASKLAGEVGSRREMGDGPGLWIVRTAWLYGPPGNDFPAKIVAAADRLPDRDALPVVADESGSPTYSVDLAAACLALMDGSSGGTYHLVNSGRASRLEWAAHVLAHRRPSRTVRPITRQDFVRPSCPPAWAVLDAGRAAAVGVLMRDWRTALDASLTR